MDQINGFDDVYFPALASEIALDGFLSSLCFDIGSMQNT